MRTSALLLPLGLVAAATAQILPPTWGVVEHPGNRAVEIQGIPGSWVAVPALDGSVDAVASSPRQICWTGDGMLSIRDRQTGVTRNISVPAGPALFAFDSQGLLAAVWFSAVGQLYTSDAGWTAVLAIPPSASQLLDLSNPGPGSVELLVRPAGAGRRAAAAAATDRPRGRIGAPARSSAVPDLQLLVVDTTTGQTRSETVLADRSGPAALDSTGAVVFAADSGLPQVDSIQHLDQGWLLLTAASHQWAWRRGMRPQATADATSPILAVQYCPGGQCGQADVTSFTMNDTAGGTMTPAEFRLVNDLTGPMCILNTSWAYAPTSPADPSQPPVWKQDLTTPWPIDSGRGATMIVEFRPNILNPPTAEGSYQAALTIQYYIQSYDGECTGNGVPPAGTTITPLTLTFSGQGTAAPLGPVINSLDPPAQQVGAQGFTLAVNGGNFESASQGSQGSQVQWVVENADGTNTPTNLQTNYIDANDLTASVPASLLSAAGAVTIQVSNPEGSAYPGISQGVVFQILCPPQLPLQPSLVLDNASPVSNKPVKVSVTFDQNAGTCGLTGGLLKLAFTPAANLLDDPLNITLDSGLQKTRTQPFTVPAGGNLAAFGPQNYVLLDTGTTAGTFTLTAALGDKLAQWGPYMIAPAAPVILNDPTDPNNVPPTLGVAAGGLELKFYGIDNSHATSGLSFEFYATDGTVVSPGLITMNSTDITSDFATYYQDNPKDAGMFQLTATFPVSGDVTQIAKAVVTLSNPTGSTTATVPVQ